MSDTFVLGSCLLMALALTGCVSDGDPPCGDCAEAGCMGGGCPDPMADAHHGEGGAFEDASIDGAPDATVDPMPDMGWPGLDRGPVDMAEADASPLDMAQPDIAPPTDMMPPDMMPPDMMPPDMEVELHPGDPCAAPDADCTLCDGQALAPPCNGCPAGVAVPPGWVCVPGGETQIGEPDALSACARPEGCRVNFVSSAMEHAHPVWLSQPYLMRAIEMSADGLPDDFAWPDGHMADEGNMPLGRLSWYDAATMANALSARDGLPRCYTFEPRDADEPPAVRFAGVDCPGYRLPTAAEWEHAARAGRDDPTGIGPLRWREGDPNQPLIAAFDDLMWHNGNADGLQPGGLRPIEPHPWGLFDMLGNAAEWTEGEALLNDGGFALDRVVVDPGGAARSVSPHLPIILKGGGVGFTDWLSRLASRFSRPPAWRHTHSGFRPVRSLPAHAMAPPVERVTPLADERPRACPLTNPAAPPTLCDGGEAAPCNGCPAGTVVPTGWVCVPAGAATIGQQSPGCAPAECCTAGGAERAVELSRPYLIQATEVTQAQFFTATGGNPSAFSSCGGDCPVTTVTLLEMMLYLNALSARDGLEPCYAIEGCQHEVADPESGEVLATLPWRPGRGNTTRCAQATQAVDDYPSCTGYRLPTEAEWEVAARGRGPTAALSTYAGDLLFDPDALHVPALDAIAWYAGNAAPDYPLGFTPRPTDGGLADQCGGEVARVAVVQPVGTKAPNAFGVCDALGNAHEMTWDHWAPVEALAPIDPIGWNPDGADEHWAARVIFKGGSVSAPTARMRASFRISTPSANGRVSTMGFRPVRTVEGQR